VPEGLSSAAQFLTTFDWLLLMLSVLESAPLATLAYTLATLLHTHSSSHPQPDASHTAQHTAHTDTHTAHTQRTASYRCPHCGAALAKQQQYAAALRYGHCGKCKGK